MKRSTRISVEAFSWQMMVRGVTGHHAAPTVLSSIASAAGATREYWSIHVPTHIVGSSIAPLPVWGMLGS
jgi:hypothetical protein